MSEIIIHVPENLNEENILVMQGVLLNAIQDKSCRLIILAGNEKVFCRGMDFNFIYENASANNFEPIRSYAKFVLELYQCVKPTVACILGETFGGGLGLAAACDYVIAAESAIFGLPEALFGFAPGVVMAFLSLRCSLQTIKKIIMRAESFSAIDAFRFGIIDQLVLLKDYQKACNDIKKALLRTNSDAIVALKQFTIKQENQSIKQKLALGMKLLEERLSQQNVLANLYEYYHYGMINLSE